MRWQSEPDTTSPSTGRAFLPALDEDLGVSGKTCRAWDPSGGVSKALVSSSFLLLLVRHLLLEAMHLFLVANGEKELSGTSAEMTTPTRDRNT